jgi:hypothetical protein
VKKLAVFVEGYTELRFVDALIETIAGAHNVLIEHREIRGGARARRTFGLLKAAEPASGQQYWVMIVDCGNDDLVKDRIREEHRNLTRSGYSKIIGMRDVRPDFTHADIPRLERGLRMYIETSLIPVEFILSIMEIEAWFLAEFNHFPRIDAALTAARISDALGFDPSVDDMTLRLTPTDDLNACYGLVGKPYTPVTTTAALDYEYVYLEMGRRIAYADRLIRSIDAFLTAPGA